MFRCDGCKHKDSCVSIPYGCECFELDLEEHDKHIRAKAIDECIDVIDYCVTISECQGVLRELKAGGKK
ncbi:MAG: hypothetical protein KBT03_04820 [Bacteroidales bacterium]|nr:hypothetical protein [Candidatus Scybalousia scybalohippi]